MALMVYWCSLGQVSSTTRSDFFLPTFWQKWRLRVWVRTCHTHTCGTHGLSNVVRTGGFARLGVLELWTKKFGLFALTLPSPARFLTLHGKVPYSPWQLLIAGRSCLGVTLPPGEVGNSTPQRLWELSFSSCTKARGNRAGLAAFSPARLSFLALCKVLTGLRDPSKNCTWALCWNPQ